MKENKISRRFKNNFAGVITAIVTPFCEDEGVSVDLNAFSLMVERQIKHKVAGVVVAGSTGEGHALTDEEFCSLLRSAESCIKRAINAGEDAASDFKLIANINTNNTAFACNKIKLTKGIKIDAFLCAAPYYVKPTQDGLMKHFKAISDTCKDVGAPIILYNVPSRTGGEITVETVAKLATECENIVGIKDATGDLSRVQKILHAMPNEVADNFAIISGEDGIVAQFCEKGGCGVISVVSNVLPTQMGAVYKACVSNNYQEAKKINESFDDFTNAMFEEPNPSPVKYALSRIDGLGVNNVLRLPLLPVAKNEVMEKINTEMIRFGVENEQ